MRLWYGPTMHHLDIVITLAGGLAVALLFGALTRRLGLSTLVGYLLAGVVVGPHTPGFVADQGLASQLAEVGVILLMFGVGLHFHPQELLRVWRVAVPGAVGQSLVAGLAGKPAGWFVLAVAICFLVAAIRREDNSGATEIGLGIEGTGGCSGCGGCGGCGG